MTSVISSRDGRITVPLSPVSGAHARLSFDNGLERLDLCSGEQPDALLVSQFAEPPPPTATG